MKRKLIYGVLILALLAITFNSCKKEQYFFNSGTINPKFNGTMVDYFNSRPNYFDTLNRVIKLAGMSGILSDDANPVTFFAPPSSCIYKSINRLNAQLKRNGQDTVSQLSQIKPELWRQYLSMYIFAGKYRLKDFPQLDTLAFNAFPGQGYQSREGRTMNIGVNFGDEGGIKYAGYRQLFISYIPDRSNPTSNLLNIPVATSDIEPTNGFIHVLTINKHNFGFNTSVFIDDVIASGVDPVQ